MDIGYVILPFVSWLIAGSTKFIMNSVNARQLAFGKIGYGGIPSNHSAIVSSLAAFIALREGISNPAFGIAITLAFIVIMDAGGLRKHIGAHARTLNKLSKEENATDESCENLRESIGHSKLEIVAGIIVGIGSAWLVNSVSG